MSALQPRSHALALLLYTDIPVRQSEVSLQERFEGNDLGAILKLEKGG